MDHGEQLRDVGPPEARYANYFKVGYNAFEFLIDFAQLYHDSASARVGTRVIIGPAYAKNFLETLAKSIEEYEQTFGAIPRMNGEHEEGEN
jgi:hypothetical protein